MRLLSAARPRYSSGGLSPGAAAPPARRDGSPARGREARGRPEVPGPLHWDSWACWAGGPGLGRGARPGGERGAHGGREYLVTAAPRSLRRLCAEEARARTHHQNCLQIVKKIQKPYGRQRRRRSWAAEGRGRARTRSRGGLGPAIVACRGRPGPFVPAFAVRRILDPSILRGRFMSPGRNNLTPARGCPAASFLLSLSPLSLSPISFSLSVSISVSLCVCSFSSFSPQSLWLSHCSIRF